MSSASPVPSEEGHAGSIPALLPAAGVRTYLALGKLRLTSLVAVAAGAGYLVALGEDLFLEPDRFGRRILVLFATLLGTGLVAAGANAFNQALEWKLDRRMARTRGRPVASGAIPPRHALLFATLVTFGGLSLLCGTSHSLAALLALAALLLYVVVYTPLKRRATQNTLVGAIPGAIPPLIGWAAARGELEPAAGVLFALIFAWQIPHFLAIAWIYREEYAAAGFKMLPVGDATGASTSRVALLYTLALLPISLAAPLFGLGGWIYTAGASLCGLTFLAMVARFAWRRTRQHAREVFLASLAYLPAVFLLMVVDLV